MIRNFLALDLPAARMDHHGGMVFRVQRSIIHHRHHDHLADNLQQ